MKRRKDRSKSKGQAIVEYIIIIVIVAVAALTVMGIFSDRIRTIIAGVASTFGAEDASSAVETSSVETLQSMDADGIDVSGDGS
jgi:Flp pilus assembly pilin Flp